MKQTIEEAKLFEYWKGALSERETAEIKAALESDNALRGKYDELLTVFQTLEALKVRQFTPERNLSAQVLEKVNSSKEENWRLYMKMNNKSVFGLVAASCCVLLALFLTRSTPVSIYEAEDGKKYQTSEEHLTVLKEVKKKEADGRYRPDVSIAKPNEPASEPAKDQAVTQLSNPHVSVSELIGKGITAARNEVQNNAMIGLEATDEYAPAPSGRGFMPPYPMAGGTEQYGEYKQQQLVSPREQQLSTFSIDVDTGSYTNMRRFIKLGQLPPPNSVRAEEFINYFDYKYETSSDKPFAVTYEMVRSPLKKNKHIVRLGLKSKEAVKIADKGWNLVFLVDVSGSMAEADKLPLVQQSLKLIVEKMRPQDRISIVTYAGYDRIALEPTSGTEKTRINSVIDSLSSGGGTNGAAGIEGAYELARKAFIADSVNRVILATDGDFNVGVSSFDDLMRLAEEKRKTGITLTTIGVGQGNLNEKMLEQLANRGNGNYFYLDSFREARKVFSEELTANMTVVAKDVKLQVEFNPAKVRRYRLIGFDNRILAKEDFKDDTVDAGEIGSGHTVTALYEVELVGSPADVEEDLRYEEKQALVKTEEKDLFPNEIGFLKIRFKQPNSDTSELSQYPMSIPSEGVLNGSGSEDFRFANAVAGFAELLRDKSAAKGITLNSVLELAKSSKGEDLNGKRAEFVELVEDAKRIMPE